MSDSYTPTELAALKRVDLQKLCKRADIHAWTAVHRPTLKANGKNAEMVEALEAFFSEQQPAKEAVEEKEDAVMIESVPIVASSPVQQPNTPQIAAAISSTPALEVAQQQQLPVVAMDFAPTEPISIVSRQSYSLLSTSIPSAEDFPPLDDDEEDIHMQEQAEEDEEEIMQLEREVEEMERKAAEDAKKTAKKTTDKPASKSIKKTIAPVPIVSKAKSIKKSIAPTAAVKKIVTASAPAAAAAPMFSRKTVTNKKKPIGAAKKPTTTTEPIIAAAAPPSPPSNSLASAFTLPSSSTTSTAPSNDAYWSLMAELDKRVDEKKKVEVEAGVVNPTFAASITGAAPVAATKKTSKFDAIHAKQAAKQESIVDYQARLEARKRATATATPLVGGAAKKRKTHHAPAASPVVAAAASSSVPFSLPTASPFTAGKRTLPAATPAGMKKRLTRSSFKGEERKPAMVPASVRKSVKKAAPAVVRRPITAFAKGSETRALFSSKIPVRSASNASTSVSAPAAVSALPPTTFTQIACLEDLLSSSSSSSSSAAAKHSAPLKKFDLASSLARPLSWKPHKGKLTAGEKKEQARTAAAATKKAQDEKENAMVDVHETAPAAASSSAFGAQPFQFDAATFKFDASTAVFSAPTNSSTVVPTSGLTVQKQPSGKSRALSRELLTKSLQPRALASMERGAGKREKMHGRNGEKRERAQQAMRNAQQQQQIAV